MRRRPLPEIRKEVGMEKDTPMLLTKAACGLVQAPEAHKRTMFADIDM